MAIIKQCGRKKRRNISPFTHPRHREQPNDKDKLAHAVSGSRDGLLPVARFPPELSGSEVTSVYTTQNLAPGVFRPLQSLPSRRNSVKSDRLGPARKKSHNPHVIKTLRLCIGKRRKPKGSNVGDSGGKMRRTTGEWDARSAAANRTSDAATRKLGPSRTGNGAYD